MFPEIGAKKGSKEKRRIKPTYVDPQKSASLNFSTECFQQPSPLALEDNAVFKQQKLQPKESSSNFETERNILKKERHKLMEKFNILNTSSTPKSPLMPQIKVTQKDLSEKSQNFAKIDVKGIIMKEKVDLLVDIYDVLFRNNLILSVNTEIYYLISLLLSKQCEEDCTTAENKLTEKDYEYLLKSINNCTYFAVRSLWNLRSVLEVILDKNSLKTLGENKKVRSFFPDLAKFLLNCYGLRCEAESNQYKPRTQEHRSSNGVICFNFETDNVENFPSMLSFQNFKKQRDMFYEIIRWYQESRSLGAGASRTSFRARVKSLTSGALAPAPANHAHLATLFTKHMLAECPPNNQESKLSKLQRRLTCPAAPESNRLPQFTDKELFYKDFIMNAESETFRVHLRDALSSEIIALDAMQVTVEDRGNSNTDITKDYVNLTKKLSLLSKFLGFLTSLPYSTQEYSTKGLHIREHAPSYAAPNDKVLENDLAKRNYSQPNINLTGMLIKAQENGRLSITIPWIVHYLSMLDYTSLRTKYYRDLLKILFNIYTNTLKFNENLKKNTVIYLKSVLGWLFDLPHFPQELFYEKQDSASIIGEVNIDSCDLVDECVIFDLCPYLRDVNVLLSTCRVSQVQKVCSYRHITPVSLSLNPEDRIKSKEKELQSRLEEELLKSQPASTRRVVELVVERVTAAAVRELSATVLVQARETAKEQARRLVKARAGDDPALILQSLQALYLSQLSSLRALAPARAAGAAAAAPLHALAARAAAARLAQWVADNWNTTAVLCKDIESEMQTFLVLGELAATPTPKPSIDVDAMTLPAEQFDAVNVSPAACIINLKEVVCQLLEGEEIQDLGPLLSLCAKSCLPNNIFCRAPTQRAILQLSVDLCIVYVSKKPKEVNDVFLNNLHMVWNVCCPDRKPPTPQEITLPERREDLSPDFRNFEDEERPPTPVSDDEQQTNGTEPKELKIITEPIRPEPAVQPENSKKINTNPEVARQEQTEPANEFLEFFDRILCPRNIVLLSASMCSDVWEAMATVLVFLLKNYYLSEDSLTEQCLAVYRQDWPQTTLEYLSTCMKSVSSRWSRSSTGKFTLFLDFLAEYCGDMDYEPID
ncbi:hypothetical protein O3G_MSEX003090 [Manduca sexta]|uniref:Codanin-1 C-terminal domain-containing protein n=1 Tax=Manduca sexta TaxID=7130 RepID=A0A921YQU5_MANSE|nr:hypothetical protein O3G_MSEX003090 [Manduca sexta]